MIFELIAALMINDIHISNPYPLGCLYNVYNSTSVCCDIDAITTAYQRLVEAIGLSVDLSIFDRCSTGLNEFIEFLRVNILHATGVKLIHLDSDKSKSKLVPLHIRNFRK